MAKYEGTYACGHDGVVNVIGKMRDRQRKIDYAFRIYAHNVRKKKERNRLQKKIKTLRCYQKNMDFQNWQDQKSK